MASISKIFGFSDRKEEADVLRTLNKLDHDKTRVQVEIENSPIQFQSVVKLKKGMVAIGKPPGVNLPLQIGSLVRMIASTGEGTRVIQLKVIASHINVGESAVFCCAIPTAFSGHHGRTFTRFDTRRLPSLRVEFPGLEDSFKVVDLSHTGLRFSLEGRRAPNEFPIGKPIAPVTLKVLQYTAELANLTPRSHHNTSVGCVLNFNGSEPAKKIIEKLLSKLEELSAKAATV